MISVTNICHFRDIYFLDDSLNAVDAYVGSYIFEKLIVEALRNKSVLFVTHNIQVSYLIKSKFINELHEKHSFIFFIVFYEINKFEEN